MLFNSPEFLFAFLPVTLAVYWGLDRWVGRPQAIAVLSVASIFFYGWWNYRYAALLIGSVAVNFVISRTITAAARRTALWLAVAGISFNLGLLFYFKYANFALGILSGTAGLEFTSIHVVLPIGISFFTFQQIAFLADTYAGKCEERRIAPYALFVTFFPQLIAGPIVHHAEMMPQFRRGGSEGSIAANLAVGFTIFVIGLSKKMILADTFAILASPTFNDAAAGQVIPFWNAWIGVLAYTLQIYFDFSGYSDMAIGLGRMFGIRLPINFASPYKARSMIDFWRRWHITLSRFLRDYLYIPLGGNRKGMSRTYVNIAITMVLGGLWHGASWTFVLWGAVHGTALMVNRLWGRMRIPLPGGRATGSVLTVLVVILAWVLFRADTLAAAGHIYAGMFGANGIAVPHAWASFLGAHAGLSGMLGLFSGDFPLSRETRWVPLLVGYLLVFFAPNTQTLMRGYQPGLQSRGYPDPVEIPALARFKWVPGWGHAVALGILFACCAAKLNDVSAFIYFQF